MKSPDTERGLPGDPSERQHLLLCDGILLLALALFSYVVHWMMPEYLAGLPRDRGFSPLTRVVLGNPWAVHLPSLLISGLTVANLLGKLTRVRSWTFCAVACFAVFVLLSALWLVGTTNPFWRIE